MLKSSCPGGKTQKGPGRSQDTRSQGHGDPWALSGTTHVLSAWWKGCLVRSSWVRGLRDAPLGRCLQRPAPRDAPFRELACSLCVDSCSEWPGQRSREGLLTDEVWLGRRTGKTVSAARFPALAAVCPSRLVRVHRACTWHSHPHPLFGYLPLAPYRSLAWWPPPGLCTVLSVGA